MLISTRHDRDESNGTGTLLNRPPSPSRSLSSSRSATDHLIAPRYRARPESSPPAVECRLAPRVDRTGHEPQTKTRNFTPGIWNQARNSRSVDGTRNEGKGETADHTAARVGQVAPQYKDG